MPIERVTAMSKQNELLGFIEAANNTGVGFTLDQKEAQEKRDVVNRLIKEKKIRFVSSKNSRKSGYWKN